MSDVQNPALSHVYEPYRQVEIPQFVTTPARQWYETKEDIYGASIGFGRHCRTARIRASP